MTSNSWSIPDMDKVCKIKANTPSPFPYLKHLQAIDPSFVTMTKLSSNELKKTIEKELKWICKLFEINEQQDF